MYWTNFYLLISILCLSVIVEAQDLNINEGLKSREPEIKKFKFLFEFDNKTNLGAPFSFRGYKLGAKYNERHDFGLGIFNNNIFYEEVLDGVLEKRSILSYSTFFYQYAVVNTPRWELSVPIQFGRGNAEHNIVAYRMRGGEGKTVNIQNDIVTTVPLKYQDKFTVFELGLDGQYVFHEWLGIGAGLGMRQLLSGDDHSKKLIQSGTYSLKLKIFFGKIIKSVHNYMSYEETYLRSQNPVHSRYWKYKN